MGPAPADQSLLSVEEGDPDPACKYPAILVFVCAVCLDYSSLKIKWSESHPQLRLLRKSLPFFFGIP